MMNSSIQGNAQTSPQFPESDAKESAATLHPAQADIIEKIFQKIIQEIMLDSNVIQSFKDYLAVKSKPFQQDWTYETFKMVYEIILKDLQQQRHNDVPAALVEIFLLKMREVGRFLTIVSSRNFYIACASILALLSILAGISYHWISERTVQDQAVAAEGVSDIAMALVYARVHHIKPQKQSWIDPEFLTSNLGAILSTEYPTFANIDKQGQFQNCPYLLRVYTSSDLSQFLVIAQPSPGWLSWFMSPEAIVVGSQTMELRKISDLKTLNRLLVNSASLDQNSSSDTFQFIQQGELFLLDQLGKQKGFATPKALALLRPGSENRIYNAPRYYHFGESILKQALNLMLHNSNAQELTRLQQQVDSLKSLQDLVLYNTLGLERSIEAQRALTSLMAPRLPFLYAYLNIDSDGRISNSQLLIESNEDNIAQLEQNEESDKNENAKISHPIYLELSLLAKERSEVLKIIGLSIEELLEKNSKVFMKDFDDQLAFLISKYQRVNTTFHDRIANRIIELHQEYADLPEKEFKDYLNKIGLLDLAIESLNVDKELKAYQHIETNIIKASFKNIENSNTIKDLYKHVEDLSNLIKIAHLQNEKINTYKQDLKSLTKQKLKHLISYENSLLQNELITITNILYLASITEKEDISHFLNQFAAFSSS